MDAETFHAVCHRIRQRIISPEQGALTQGTEPLTFEPALAPVTASVLQGLQRDFPLISPLVLEGIYYRVLQIDGRRCIWEYDRRGKSPSEVWAEWEALWDGLHESLEGMSARDGHGERREEQVLTDECSLESSMLIMEMARTYDGVSPCYLARQIVRGYVGAINETARQAWQAKQAAARSSTEEPTGMTGPDTVQGGEAVKPPAPAYPKKLNHVRLYRDPSSIPHKGLAANVLRCHRLDPHCSPAMDEYRTRIGRQYEGRLETALTALGIPFLNEPAMRRLKYARTPDTILLEPIAIDGLAVKWIESKAWFGDPTAHASYLRDQYWPYYNRFGPGLVVYWFGYVREPAETHRHQGILVMDAFPPQVEAGAEGGGALRITRITSPLTDLVLSSKPKVVENTTDSNEQ